MLTHKADPNLPQKKIALPLSFAVLKDDLEMVRLLLENGADPNLPDGEGHASASYALTKNNSAMIELLKKPAHPSKPPLFDTDVEFNRAIMVIMSKPDDAEVLKGLRGIGFNISDADYKATCAAFGKYYFTPFMERWFASDPKSCADWLLRTPPEERTNLLAELLFDWARRDYAAAMAFARKLPADPGLDAVKYGLSCLVDPEKTLAEALALPDTDERRLVLMTNGFLGLSVKGADAIAAWFAGNPVADSVKGQALVNCLLVMAQLNDRLLTPAFALALSDLIPDPYLKGVSYECAVRNLILNNPRKAYEMREALKNRALRDADDARLNVWQVELPKLICDSWGKREPATAARRVLADKELAPYLELVLDHWAESSPEACLDWMEANLEEKALDSATRRLIGGWSKSNPAAALAFISGAGADRANRDAVIGDLMFNYASISPEEALATLERIKGKLSPEARRQACVGLAVGWHRKDLAAALKWVETLESKTRDLAIGYITANTIDEAAKAFKLADMIRDPLVKDQALSMLYDPIWSAEDAVAAEAIRAKVGEFFLFSKVADDLCAWGKKDPGAALDWLDEAWRGSRLALPQNDYAITLTRPTGTANAIRLKDRYVGLLVKIHLAWYKNDPEKAMAWLEQAKLDSDIKEQLKTR